MSNLSLEDVSGREFPVEAVRDTKKPNWLVIVVILAFGWLWWSGKEHDRGDNVRPDDQTIIVDDDKTTPVPVSDAWLLFVYESEDSDANFLSVFENKPYRDALETRGLKPYFQDVDIVPDDIQTQAKTVGLPAVFVIQRSDKKVITAFALPDGGPAGLDTELKQRVGK